MSSHSETEDEKGVSIAEGQKPLVARSQVVAGKPYREYLPILRDDFLYACAYCTILEVEAQGIRFEIDHYEPRKARPDLEHAYDNLMYSCGVCNQRKGDICPPAEARAAGLRFFRPDWDVYEDHFDSNGIMLSPKSPVGEFTIDYVDLNRLMLRRLRDIRERAYGTHELVVEGINALRRFPIDQLPTGVKGKAAKAIKDWIEFADACEERIDAVLKDMAKSPLLDTDAEAKSRQSERQEKMKRYKALFEGNWNSPK